jgi:hypothetical protein
MTLADVIARQKEPEGTFPAQTRHRFAIAESSTESWQPGQETGALQKARAP